MDLINFLILLSSDRTVKFLTDDARDDYKIKLKKIYFNIKLITSVCIKFLNHNYNIDN
jgi:hypothetical protein